MMRAIRLLAIVIVPILLVMQGCETPTGPQSTGQSLPVTNHDVPQLQEVTYPQPSAQTRGLPMLPTFRWTASALTTLPRRSYQLRVVEVQRGQGILSAFENNAPILDRVVVDTTSLVWPADLPIKPQHTYAWSVRSLDTNGMPTGGNGGGWPPPKISIPPDPKRPEIATSNPGSIVTVTSSGTLFQPLNVTSSVNPEWSLSVARENYTVVDSTGDSTIMHKWSALRLCHDGAPANSGVKWSVTISHMVGYMVDSLGNPTANFILLDMDGAADVSGQYWIDPRKYELYEYYRVAVLIEDPDTGKAIIVTQDYRVIRG